MNLLKNLAKAYRDGDNFELQAIEHLRSLTN